MRLRFSLRTLFALTTICGVFCAWIVLPSLKAHRFLHSVAAKDYATADRFFRDPEDQFLAAWADKRWAFAASADLQPWTLGQLVRGQRQVLVRLSYFALDQNAGCTASISAAALGLGRPALSPITYGGTFIDAIPETTMRR